MLQNQETRETNLATIRPIAAFQVVMQGNKPHCELDREAPLRDVTSDGDNIYIDWEQSNEDRASFVFQVDEDDPDITELAGLQLGVAEGDMQEDFAQVHFDCRCDPDRKTRYLELYKPPFELMSVVYSLTIIVVNSSNELRRHDPKIYNQGPK